MSTANAKIGSAIDPQAAEEKTPPGPAHRPTPDFVQDYGPLLAQIPDLDLKTTPNAPKKRAEGRVISQALSIKLVFGLGLALVVGAILPFIIGKASRSEHSVKELPEWSSNVGSVRSVDTSQGVATGAPTAPSSQIAPATAAVSPHVPPNPTPAIVVPQPRQVSETRPAALSEPSWPTPGSSIAPPPAVMPTPGANNNSIPPATAQNWPGSGSGYVTPASPNPNPPQNRGFDRPLDPRNWQADVRNDPAAQYRNNDPRFDYRGNPVDAPPVGRDVPPGGYPRDIRFDNPGGAFPPATGPGSPLMPAGAQGPASTYSNQPLPEPGVPRFDGTIGPPPPVRTNYDRSGSSPN
jgi:hypothetical protein